MMIFVKALAFAIFLGLIGLVIGPIAGLLLMSAPVESCGMWWIIPIGMGAALGACAGAVGGFFLGLVI